MSYTDSHRALLQAVIERGAVSADDARQLVVKLFRNNESTQSFMNHINIQLEPLNMTIKNVACEITGKTYWVLVSTLLDETARFQTQFSASELELLRKILSEIVTSVDGSASSIMCLNLCCTLENRMSKDDAERFLANMVENRWFVARHGKFYMGVRSIAELIPYFKSTYQEDVINTCSLCRQTVFHGKRCIHCQHVLHRLCFANSARVQNPPKCPTCNEVMTTENIQDFEPYNDRSMSLPGTSSQGMDDDDENDNSRRASSKKRKAARR